MDLAEKIAALSPAKRALLEARLERRRGAAPASIPARRRRDRAPLTSGQMGLWFIDQLNPGASNYSIPMAMRLRGRLDGAALQETLDRMVARHEVLRTTIVLDGEVPVQAIAEQGSLPLVLDDLGRWPEEEREAEARCLLDAEARQPFDLAAGPLARARLVRLDERDHLLIINMHHIIADGVSLEVLYQEVSRTYGALLEGREPLLPPVAIPFGDWAEWHEDKLRREFDDMLRFWREYLDGYCGFLDLHPDDPAASSRHALGGGIRIPLAQEVEDCVRAINMQERATVYMTMLTAFLVLLRDRSGQDDIVVGTPSACRTRLDVEAVVGLFVNMVPIRVRLPADATFRELLRVVRESTLASFTWQDTPFMRMVEALSPPRKQGRNPLFQVVFSYGRKGSGSLHLPDLEMTRVRRSSRSSKFDMGMGVQERSRRLTCYLEYNADMFERETVQGMADDFPLRAGRMLAEPDRRVSELR